MASDASIPALFHADVLSVYTFYAALARDLDPVKGLGGKLVYAGALDGEGAHLVRAANIAGAASLSATPDPVAQKLAIREGVVDFLVTSFDEAVRILKNEIRKKQAAAVCVGLAPEAIEREMHERGVLPDLFRPDAVHPRGGNPEFEFDERLPMTAAALVRWSIQSAPARVMPRLDAIALERLPQHAVAARRWLRLAPRYLGRSAQGLRLVAADREFAAAFVENVRNAVATGQVPSEVLVQVSFRGGNEEHHLVPPTGEQPI